MLVAKMANRHEAAELRLHKWREWRPRACARRRRNFFGIIAFALMAGIKQIYLKSRHLVASQPAQGIIVP